jgi:hypothetical protein
MTSTSLNDYDNYAFLMLMFACDECHVMILPPEGYDDDLGEKYQHYIARRAEFAGWYISLADGMPCLCPDCRKKKGL